jgi:uncharacterized protein (TIGR03435 family)
MKTLILLASLAVASGQTLSFEVASIKPSPPPDGTGMSVYSRGGPGSKDPGMWTCHNMSLSNLVSNAFQLRAKQLIAPDWMDQQRFEITAKVPDGATKEQFSQMLQNMLIERFGLKFHREKREVQGFELVLAKNGPKFKESEPEPPKDVAADPARAPQPMRPNLGADGFPTMPPGQSGMIMMNNRARSQWMRTSMDSLAVNLAYQAGKPVNDGTGLKGKYDVALYWVPDSMRTTSAPSGGELAPPAEVAGPNLFTALQEQLGLKLDPKKVTIEVLVVDHAEKLPTEN